MLSLNLSRKRVAHNPGREWKGSSGGSQTSPHPFWGSPSLFRDHVLSKQQQASSGCVPAPSLPPQQHKMEAGGLPVSCSPTHTNSCDPPSYTNSCFGSPQPPPPSGGGVPTVLWCGTSDDLRWWLYLLYIYIYIFIYVLDWIISFFER